jgi:hypothetical protein
MIDDRIADLINSEIDGANSAEKSKELRRSLDTNPEAQRYYRQLIEMEELFRSAGEIEPPSELRSLIARSIRSERTERLRKGIIASILDTGGLRNRRKYALSFLCGLAAGVIVFAVIFHLTPAIDRGAVKDYSGTISREREDEHSTVSARAELESAGIRGYINIIYKAAKISAELAIDSESEIEVVFDPQGNTAFEGIEVHSCVGEHDIFTKDGRSKLTHSGTCEYIISFRDDNRLRPPVRVTVYSGGRAVIEKTLHERQI